MKIRVIGKVGGDGEVWFRDIELLGEATIHERVEGNTFAVLQSNGMDYYFYEDGTFDGTGCSSLMAGFIGDRLTPVQDNSMQSDLKSVDNLHSSETGGEKAINCVRCAIGIQQAHEQNIPYEVGNCPDCLGSGHVTSESKEPEKLNNAQKWPPTITLSHGAPPAGSSPIGALAESSLSSPLLAGEFGQVFGFECEETSGCPGTTEICEGKHDPLDYFLITYGFDGSNHARQMLISCWAAARQYEREHGMSGT